MPGIIASAKRPTRRPQTLTKSGLFCTPCALSAANSPLSAPFPPRDRKKFHQAVLKEILDELVASRRHRSNPRGVKRKMSNFPLRRGYKRSPPFDICAAIRIIK
jgi:hypothetical protein